MPGAFDNPLWGGGGGFTPVDPLGQPTQGFSGALTSRGNSLIGMGMGLLQPHRPWAGESPWTNALQGWQTGSALDQRTAQQQQELRMQQERMRLAREQANREPEQIRLLRAAGIDPTSAEGREALFPKQSAVREGKVTYRDQEYPYQVDQRGNVRWLLGPPPGYSGSQQPGAAPTTTDAVPYIGTGPMGTGAPSVPSTTGAGATPAQIAGLPPPPPGLENEPWSVQKAVRQKQLEEAVKHATKDPQQEAAAKRSAADVLSALDTAEKLVINEGGMLPTTGILGGKLTQVYQPAADLEGALETLGANISIDKLSAMRSASTSGASGLGAVTKEEHEMLKSTIAAVKQSQSQQQLLANLRRVRATYDWIINRKSPNEPPPFSMRPSSTIPTTESGGGGGGQPVRVRTPAEARQLPSGTRIILPDGSEGRVP